MVTGSLRLLPGSDYVIGVFGALQRSIVRQEGNAAPGSNARKAGTLLSATAHTAARGARGDWDSPRSRDQICGAQEEERIGEGSRYDLLPSAVVPIRVPRFAAESGTIDESFRQRILVARPPPRHSPLPASAAAITTTRKDVRRSRAE